jgi:hypothetical protein
MASAQEIRELVSNYVASEVSAADVANSPVLRAGLKSHDNSVKELAISVHAMVSRYLHSLISESSLCESLKPYTMDVRIVKKFSADPKFIYRKKDEPLSGRVELDLEYA